MVDMWCATKNENDAATPKLPVLPSRSSVPSDSQLSSIRMIDRSAQIRRISERSPAKPSALVMKNAPRVSLSSRSRNVFGETLSVVTSQSIGTGSKSIWMIGMTLVDHVSAENPTLSPGLRRPRLLRLCNMSRLALLPLLTRTAWRRPW